MSRAAGPDAGPVLGALRDRIGDDLDTPGALAVVDAWSDRALEPSGPEPAEDPAAPGLVARALDALLGIRT